MSFASAVKSEVARLFPERSCCQRAELAALVRTSGNLRLSADGGEVVLVTENVAVARKLFWLTKSLGLAATVVLSRARQPRPHNFFRVLFPLEGCGKEVLRELGLIDKKGRLRAHLNSGLFHRVCCRRSFRRGLFLGGGFVSRPESSYHLELVFETLEAAQEAGKVLARCGLAPHYRERKGSFAVYLKDADSISAFLVHIGAYQAVLAFENSRIWKEMRNQVNRLVNCETANLKKTVEAGLAQVEDIKYIASCSGLGALSPPLREVAELRLRHPEASLKELGNLLDPPVGKSGVNHRLRALRALAARLRAERGD